MISKLFGSFLSQFWEELATPFSLKCYLLFKHEEWDQLADVAVDPSHYLDPWSFQNDRLAADIVRKNTKLDTTFDLEDVAINTWFDSEYACHKQNDLFRDLAYEPHTTAFGTILATSRKIVRRFCFGVEHNWAEFGPGATLSNSRKNSDYLTKMSVDPTVTKLCLAPAAISMPPGYAKTFWHKGHPKTWRIVRADRYVSVYKSSKTNRGIAIPPLANVACQRGIGECLALGLKRNGIDLALAPEIHRSLAREGSITGAWATIDVRGASDNVGIEIVKAQFPSRVFQLMYETRTSFTEFPGGETVLLNKFSAMGNGYTFELETILFLSLSCATVQYLGGDGIPGVDVFTFGDDIIVRNEYAPAVSAVLQALGFRINTEKSYWSGNFRESCGGDYFLGVPVKGVSPKEEPSNPLEWQDLANRLYELWGLNPIAQRAVLGLRRNCIKQIPSRLRCYGPRGRGNTFIVDDDEYLYQLRSVKLSDEKADKDGIYSIGLEIKSLLPMPYRHKRFPKDANPYALLGALSLGKISSQGIPREFPSGFRTKWIAYYGVP